MTRRTRGDGIVHAVREGVWALTSREVVRWTQREHRLEDGARRDVGGDLLAGLLEQLGLVPLLEILERVGVAQRAGHDAERGWHR